MRKLLIRLGIAAVMLVVLLIAAAVILPFVIPTETYRDQLIAEVKAATGRDMRIDGPMHVSVLPRLAIEAEKLSLANVPGAQSKDMVTVGKLQAVLELLPLIHGQVVVDKFIMTDPVIALEVDKQGRGNWMTAAPAAGASPAAPSPPTGNAGSGAFGMLKSLRLGQVGLQNGTVSYFDARSGHRTVVDKIDMTVSFPDINAPLKVDGSVAYKSVPVAVKIDAGKTSDFMTAAGTPVEMSAVSPMINFTFKGKGSATSTEGTIDLKIPSLRKLSGWLEASLPAQGPGFGPFAIAGKLTWTGETVDFTNADVSFDAINGKGDVAIDESGPRPKVKGDLTIAALDLNPYLGSAGAPGKEGSGSSTNPSRTSPASSGWSDAPIDVSGLKAADVDFKLNANAIQFEKIHIDRSSVTAHLDNGKLDLNLTDLAAYQGSGKADLTLDAGASQPALALTVSVANVQVQPLLRDTISLERLTGKGNLELSVTSHGDSERALISALNGKGSLNVANGEITGFDLLKLLNTAASAVGSAVGSVLSGGGGSGTTPFSHLTGTYTIASGVMHNNDLRLESPGLQADGAGTIDLPHRTIDYKVTPKVVGLSVPLIVRGPLDNPSYLPDLAGIVKGGVGGTIDTLKGVLPGGGGSSGGSSGGGPGGILKGILGK